MQLFYLAASIHVIPVLRHEHQSPKCCHDQLLAERAQVKLRFHLAVFANVELGEQRRVPAIARFCYRNLLEHDFIALIYVISRHIKSNLFM